MSRINPSRRPSLVDPDNRRSVDFSARQQVLAELRPLVDQIERGDIVEREVRKLLAHWSDGRIIKFLVTTCGLRFRRQHFDHSSLPLATAWRTCPVALLWAPAREEGVQADAA